MKINKRTPTTSRAKIIAVGALSCVLVLGTASGLSAKNPHGGGGGGGTDQVADAAAICDGANSEYDTGLDLCQALTCDLIDDLNGDYVGFTGRNHERNHDTAESKLSGVVVKIEDAQDSLANGKDVGDKLRQADGLIQDFIDKVMALRLRNKITENEIDLTALAQDIGADPISGTRVAENDCLYSSSPPGSL